MLLMGWFLQTMLQGAAAASSRSRHSLLTLLVAAFEGDDASGVQLVSDGQTSAYAAAYILQA
jgi:hypothetical protein